MWRSQIDFIQCTELLKSAWNFRNNHNFQEATKKCESALRLLQAYQGDQKTSLIFNTCQLLGDIHRKQHHYSKALLCYTFAIVSMERLASQNLNTNLLFNAVLVIWKLLETPHHTFTISYLYRFSKVCLEKCLQIEGPSQRITYFLFKNYICIGDLLSALSLVKFVVDENIPFSLRCQSKINIQELPQLLFQLFSSFPQHHTRKDSPPIFNSRKIDFPFFYLNEYRIPRNVLSSLADKSACTDHFLECILCFINSLQQYFNLSKSFTLTCLLNLRVCDEIKNTHMDIWWNQMETETKLVSTSFTKTRIGVLDEAFSIIKPPRMTKDIGKKKISDHTFADDCSKTTTELDQVLLCLDTFLVSYDSNSCGCSCPEGVSGCPEEKNSLTTFPGFKKIILNLYNTSLDNRKKRQDKQTLSLALLELCDVFIKNHYYLESPHKFLECIMQIVPHVSQSLLKDYSYIIMALLYASLHIDPPPRRIVQFCFITLQATLKDSSIVWGTTYALIVASLKSRDLKGLTYSLRLLEKIRSTSIGTIWVESAQDVVEAELLLLNYKTLTTEDTKSHLEWMSKIMYLQKTISCLFFFVSKYEFRLPLVLNVSNVLNDVNILKGFLQVLSKDVTIVLTHLVPFFCKQRLKSEETFHSSTCGSLQSIEECPEMQFIPFLFDMIGNVLALQAFLGRRLLQTACSAHMTQFIALGFDVSQGHPNTLISFLPPLLSALDGVGYCLEKIETNASLCRPHSPYLLSIKISDFTNIMTPELLQESESDQDSESTQTMNSHILPLDSVKKVPKDICSFETFFNYSAGCHACMKGCYALLQQDNAALKLFSSQCKSSLVSKQKHLYPLLSRIRFELVSIMSLLTVPLRLETFQQIEKQVDSVNNPQHVFSLMFGYLGKVNLKHEQFITSSDYIQNILKLLRHISLMDTKLFNCTTYHCVEDTVVPHLIQQYKAAFVTGDLFEISHNTLALYQETQFLDTSRRLYQGSFTCCPGLGTLSISFHLLNLCLRSFSNVRFICGWIAECQQILSTVKTCFENPFSLRITKTIQKESIEPFEIASYLPFFLKTVYWDTLDYTVFHLTRVVPKKSYCLKKCISWNTEMLIVELIGISLVRLYGLVVYPRPAPPFDACQILSPNDHEHIASILANKSDSATLSFRITTPLVLLLGVNVYKKLSLWYSGRSKKVHFSKVFRNVMAEGIESCIFIEAPDSCTLEKTKYETTFFNVTVPQPTFLQNISLNKLWTVKSFGLWAYISDPLYFPSTLEVFDEEESSKHPVSGDSIVEEGDTKTDTTLTQTQLFGCLFNAWHHKWPCLQTYGTVNLSTFSALVKPEWHEDHNRKQWTSVLQSGSILSDSDTDHLLLSWMRRRDDDIPSSDDDTSAMNSKYLHLQTAMIHFVFDPESSVQWRPFTDFKHYKILMASILKKVYNDFWFGFNSYQQLLHTFFFQALPLRAALYLPKKLLEIGFEASLWGDAFSFFFKETQVAQPSYLTRSVLSYLPTSLLTNGAYSINSLEMNELLDNLANINRAASLGYINLKSFSAAAYTHRQLFLLLNDRFAAEECWPAILPFVETMPVDDILTEHDTVCFTCHNVVPAEIPMREGVQSLFLLRVENSLLGHSMYTQVKHRMPKSICGKEVKKNAGVNLNASYQASGLECEPIVSCDSNVFYDLNDPWYALATCPFVTSLQLYADCCKDTQEKHQFENSGAKLTKSCFVQEKSEKEKACVCEGCKNVKILEQCLIPVKQLQLLNFFDCFVLYARSRVESLLVQFSLCKLTSPVPSGITLSHLKSLRDHCDQKMVQDKITLFFVYNWKGKREKNTADVLYLERINKVFFQAEELSFLFSNLTKMAGKPLLSILCSDDDTRDVKTPFKCYSLHTLKLLKSCIWIPDMILARCCLLKTKLYLYETKAVAPFLLKHYVIFLRAFVSLNKSLSYLNVQTKNNCLVTTPMTPKIQSWKTQLPSHLQCLSYHDAAPLIRLINLRSYLLLLGLYSGPSSHTNQLDVFRHLNHTQSTREFSPAKSREDNSATSTSPTYCSVPSFSGAPTLEIHDAFQLRTPHTQDQIFNSEKATFTQAHHDTWNSTETLECPSMVSLRRPWSSLGGIRHFLVVQNCVKPNVDGNSSITMNSSQCVYHNDDGLNESHETNSFSDLSISTRNLLVTNDSFSNVNQVPLQTSFVDKEDNIAWLLCSLCVWDKKLLTPQVCDELYELCNHYEKQLSMELKPNDSQKYHDAICDKLRREGASCTLFVSLQKDCFKGLNILASCFGLYECCLIMLVPNDDFRKYFTNVYQTISRFHIFTGNPLEAVKQLEPLLSKSFNRNKHMDTKSSNTSLSKQSNTALLLYHQMLLYRLRHEEKIKYKTVIFLFIILELLLDENQPTSLQSSFNPSLGQERKEAEGGLTASVDDAPVISSRTITNLPAGMFHATILSHLPHTFVNHNKQSFTTRQWKILRRHQDNIKKRKINEILTYLIDLLHFYIRCAKKQATSQEAVLLNVPMDSKALSHVLCQCILIGLYMLAQSLSKQLSDASFILPWECVNPTVAPPRNHFDTAFITPQLVKQLSSIIPLFPKQYHFLAQRYTSFVHRMSNTLLVHEVHLTHPSALVLEELTPFNDITYVLALCHLACGGKASLALKVSKGKGVYQFVESAVSHHVEEYHSLHHIFKTLSIVEKETNTNRRIPCSTLDKFRKKMKRS